MKTKILDQDQKELWVGDMPVISIGHRMNHEGLIYKVIGSGISLSGHYESELDHGARQVLVIEEQK